MLQSVDNLRALSGKWAKKFPQNVGGDISILPLLLSPAATIGNYMLEKCLTPSHRRIGVMLGSDLIVVNGGAWISALHELLPDEHFEIYLHHKKNVAEESITFQGKEASVLDGTSIAGLDILFWFHPHGMDSEQESYFKFTEQAMERNIPVVAFFWSERDVYEESVYLAERGLGVSLPKDRYDRVIMNAFAVGSASGELAGQGLIAGELQYNEINLPPYAVALHRLSMLIRRDEGTEGPGLPLSPVPKSAKLESNSYSYVAGRLLLHREHNYIFESVDAEFTALNGVGLLPPEWALLPATTFADTMFKASVAHILMGTVDKYEEKRMERYRPVVEAAVKEGSYEMALLAYRWWGNEQLLIDLADKSSLVAYTLSYHFKDLDISQSRSYIDQAASKGNADAMLDLAISMEETDIPTIEAQVKYVESAASKGSLLATFYLAERKLQLGEKREALELLWRTTRLGHQASQELLMDTLKNKALSAGERRLQKKAKQYIKKRKGVKSRT